EEITSSVPPLLRNTVNIPELTEEDFIIKAPIKDGTVTLHTMEMQLNGTTAKGKVDVEVKNGVISKLPDNLAFVTVIGRHGQNKKPFVGVIENSGLREGAYATTVAHDSH